MICMYSGTTITSISNDINIFPLRFYRYVYRFVHTNGHFPPYLCGWKKIWWHVWFPVFTAHSRTRAKWFIFQKSFSPLDFLRRLWRFGQYPVRPLKSPSSPTTGIHVWTILPELYHCTRYWPLDVIFPLDTIFKCVIDGLTGWRTALLLFDAPEK